MINDKNEWECYLDAVSKNQNRPCDFLDDSDKTYLKVQTNRKIDFLNTKVKNLDSKSFSDKIYFIVDNTKFPENGANYQNDFEIEVLYHLDLKPSDSFYLKAILCKKTRSHHFI